MNYSFQLEKEYNELIINLNETQQIDITMQIYLGFFRKQLPTFEEVNILYHP